MVQYGFSFDARRCTGCKTCMMACRDYHDLGPELAFRQIYEMTGGSWRKCGGTWEQDCYAYYVSLACNHCTRPVCMEVCPTGAMHRDERGLVSVDVRRCIGCGYCALSCPYHAPKVDRSAGCSVKCDGCTDRVAEGLPPICVAACPLRALAFGPADEVCADACATASIPPLPDASETGPNLAVVPPACFERVGEERIRRDAHVNNLRELVR